MTPWAACSNKKSMTALAFDTYKAVKALREAGADEALAEAVVATVGDAIGGNVATKADLAEVKAELKSDIAVVRADLKSDIAAVKADLKSDIAAVKADLAEVKAELKSDIAAVKTDIAEVEARLYRHLWMMAAGIVGLTVSLTVALVKLTS